MQMQKNYKKLMEAGQMEQGLEDFLASEKKDLEIWNLWKLNIADTGNKLSHIRQKVISIINFVLWWITLTHMRIMRRCYL